jgi:hypothetical protein
LGLQSWRLFLNSPNFSEKIFGEFFVPIGLACFSVERATKVQGDLRISKYGGQIFLLCERYKVCPEWRLRGSQWRFLLVFKPLGTGHG